MQIEGPAPSQSSPAVLGRVRAGWVVLLSAPAASADARETAKNLGSKEAGQMKYSMIKQTALVVASGRVNSLNCRKSPGFFLFGSFLLLLALGDVPWHIRCAICYL